MLQFSYQGCDASFKFEKDVEEKINRFLSIWGITGRKATKARPNQSYKVTVVIILICGF